MIEIPYDKMSLKELKRVYVERAREINRYICECAPKGKFEGEKVTKVNENPRTDNKDSLITRILELDVRLRFGDDVEELDDMCIVTIGVEND